MRHKEFKIAFDCNILASVLLGGITRQRFNEVIYELSRIEIIYCDKLIEEMNKLPSVKYFIEKGITTEVVSEFVVYFKKVSKNVKLKSNLVKSRDSKDNYLLNLCVDAKLTHLITGDKDLLVLEKIKKTKIVTFATFIDLLNALPF